MRRRTNVRLPLVLALGMLGIGCNGILGISQLTDSAGDGGTPGASSGSQSSSSSGSQSSSSGSSIDGGGDGGGGSAGTRPQIQINKVDLLLMIDNSASMGDKQQYLEQAIPDLINGLVNPSNSAFPAVHDLHIGIVSSSLGTRGGDQTTKGTAGAVCLPSATYSVDGQVVPNHNDDQAHLLNRASALDAGAAATCQSGACPAYPITGTLSDATPDGFLAWFPSLPANSGQAPSPGAPAITTQPTLVTDFDDGVAGVQQFGCGIESQLESWYRFLIQPDPYASVTVTSGSAGVAQWTGVDTAILQERKDFLRPDSAVVIIDLTDENDSEIDVRSAAGQGYLFMSTAFDPPRGTSACDTNPADPSCTTCSGATASDPNCAQGNYTAPTDWGYDANLRHVHMKAKYGLDPQFPLQRYVTGLTSTTVPDRNGEYPPGALSYVGNDNCVNPLFAGALADPSALSSGIGTATTLSGSDEATLCNLPQGVRPAGAVFFLIIGGVPHELLQDPTTGNTKATLSSADWVPILGTDPDSFNYNGIDPHMIESYAPRIAQPNGAPWPFTLAPPVTVADPGGGATIVETSIQPPSAANTADPWSGREWITNVGTHDDLDVDREYACIFPLTAPRDCTLAANAYECDCSTTTGENSNSQEISPLCDPTTQTQQDYGKAYPTIRELDLAKKLGPQGIVGSLCPIHVTDNANGDDPNYGYRPAITSLLTNLQPVLAFQ